MGKILVEIAKKLNRKRRESSGTIIMKPKPNIRSMPKRWTFASRAIA